MLVESCVDTDVLVMYDVTAGCVIVTLKVCAGSVTGQLELVQTHFRVKTHRVSKFSAFERIARRQDRREIACGFSAAVLSRLLHAGANAELTAIASAKVLIIIDAWHIASLRVQAYRASKGILT